MLEVINELKKIKEDYGEQVFIDSFSLNSGYHIKITNQPIKDIDLFKVTNPFKTESAEEQHQYNWFRDRFYYNCLLNNDANKCVASAKTKKKILSVIPISIIFKVQNLITNEFEDAILMYLEELRTYANGELDVLYYNDIFINKTRELKLFIQNNPHLKIKNTDAIHLYLDEDISVYKNFYELYLKKRLFLNENSCLKVDNNLLGVLSYSMSLNKPKKPTLGNTVINVDFETAENFNLISKLGSKINTILNNYSAKQKYYIKFKDRTIQSIEKYIKTQNKNYMYDYFIMREDDIESSNEPKKITNYELISLIDDNFTKGALNQSFKYNVKQDLDTLNDYIKYANKYFSDMKIVQSFVNNRDTLYEYFCNNTNVEISNTLENMLKNIFEYNIVNYNSRKQLCTKFDLLLNIMIYVSDRKENYLNMASDIKNLKAQLLEFKNNNFIEINDDESFYFIAAQLLQYLSSLSESENKSYQDAFEYYNIRNMKQLKRILIEKYTKYSYKLPAYSNSFINLVHQNVIGYGIEQAQPKNITKSKSWYYYNAGLVGENIFYIKKEKKVGNVDEK